MYDTPIEISIGAAPTASVIWLHGLGADGNDFVPVVKMLNLPNIRFILPHAAFKKVTANNGYEMRAWYDVFGFSAGSREDEAGVRESQTYVESLIQHEIDRGIPAKRIVLAGFSQGGAIALHTALRHKQALAGVMVLSAYLPLKANLAKEKSKENQHIPIFMAHGTYDNVISLDTCRISFEVLQAQHYTINWHEYPMTHSVNQQEIADIRTYLLHVLSD
ncbi:MAG: alpha/beta fold hydrolase [Methylotenera sp.]